MFQQIDTTNTYEVKLSILNIKSNIPVGNQLIYTWTFKKDDNFEGLGDHYEEITNVSKKSQQIEDIDSE